MKPRKKRKIQPVATNDPFVKEKRQPDYKKPEELRPYMTERGRILPKHMSGLTAGSQRRVAIAIKRARHLALLPFVGGVRR